MFAGFVISARRMVIWPCIAIAIVVGGSPRVSCGAERDNPPRSRRINLSSALGKQIEEKLAAVDREIVRLRHADAKGQADELSRQVLRLRDQLDGKVVPAGDPASAELHVVGIYVGAFPNGPRKYGTSVVCVEATDRPIVLTLTAYEPRATACSFIATAR
jgi:hypothetical protein